MAEVSRYGTTLRWPDGDPGRDGKVMVDVFPASPSHVVHVLYTLGGGLPRHARAWPVSRDGAVQTHAARLPEAPPGVPLVWWPVLSDGLRDLAPEMPMAGAPAVSAAPVPASTGGGRFPYEMDHLARVTAPLEKTPTMIGDTPEGLMIVFPLGQGGSLRGPKLNGSIEHVGGDWMRVRPDGVGISEVRVVVDCDDGAKLLGEYSGVVNFGRDGYEALSRGGGPERAEVQLVPRFLTAAPAYDWINRVQCVGLGRVTMSSLLVEYDLYAVRSHAFAEQGGGNA